MDKTMNSRGISLSLRVYQSLLIIYPSEFRHKYGRPMVQVFSDCCKRALNESGMAGLLLLWWRTMIDTIQTAIEEHSQRGVYMVKHKFIKLSGWALILGGLALSVGGLAGMRPTYDRFNMESLSIDRYANVAAVPLMIMGFLLISVGMIGILLRYSHRMNNFGRYSLGVGAFFGVISALATIMQGVYNNGTSWLIFSGSVTLQFLGLTFFGIASLRQCILPRSNGLPLLAGACIPLLILTGTTLELISGKEPVFPQGMIGIVLFLTLAGLISLGYLLQSDAQQADLTTAAV